MHTLQSLLKLSIVTLMRRQTARPPPRLRTRWTDACEAELREALRLRALLPAHAEDRRRRKGA